MTEKALFLKKLNEAYANNDTSYIVEQVTDDIVWTVVGEPPVKGKKAFAEATKAMENENPLKLTVHNIITHGRDAAVNGTMTAKDKDGHERTYAFCDIYKFNGFSRNAKLKEMTSYAIEVSDSN